MRFATGPEHAPTREAQLFVEREDACFEGLVQFRFTRFEGLCSSASLASRAA
jgi:hypothetical protein